MVQYIFEDNVESPVSKLLCECANGNNMHFSNGNVLLYSTIENIREKYPNDIIKVFVDVPPNRNSLIALYDSLCQKYNRFPNIYIIPYICVEYVVLNMLYRYNYLIVEGNLKIFAENTIGKFQWDKILERYREDEYIKESLEHAYKYILSNTSMKCMRNDTKSYVHGLFYINDCNCDRKYCSKLNCTDNLKLKSERLYTSLPTYDVVDDLHIKYWNDNYIKYELTDMTDVYNKIQIMYSEICESMKLQKMFVNIKE
jgi:hypothetical protein